MEEYPDDISIISEESNVYSAAQEAMAKLKAEQMESLKKIHRFPVSMRAFCRERHYIVPEAVAIGPYHRHLRALQKMEEVKKAAAYEFCRFTQQSVDQAYAKVFAVAGDARGCYDANALQDISEDAFASMMFHDACFLLLTILITDPKIKCDYSLLYQIHTSITVILKDIFLLENQIPWTVLKALVDIKVVPLGNFISTMGMNFKSRIDHYPSSPKLDDPTTPHLLGLFYVYQSGKLPRPLDRQKEPKSVQLCTSAIELAEIGIKLTSSKTARLKDIGLTKGILFRKLFLPPLHLNEHTACWLLNMAALETTCMIRYKGIYTVSSYLALFAMLMDREEDVHELRAKNLIHGEFTDRQVLNFFKGRQASNICPGSDFYDILRSLERYRQKRSLWIAIHRFVYNNIKTIITVLSVAGVLAAILKATPLLKSIS